MGNRFPRKRPMLPAYRWSLQVVLLLIPSVVGAEPNTLSEAREHFDRGVQLHNNGELGKALAEFELAHLLQPHFAVLYNLGQTHAALGHPVEAVDAYRRYLEEGRHRVSSERRSQVLAAVSLHEKQIGILELQGELNEVECEVDGHRIDREARSVPLAAGRHVVVARRIGYDTQVATVEVPPRSTAIVTIALDVKHQAEPSLTTWLRLACAIPDVEIELDGIPSGTTPLRHPLLSVRPGRRTVRLARRGYVEEEHVVDVALKRESTVSCNLKPALPLRHAESGVLAVKVSESGAQVLVDGTKYSGGRLPDGRHNVEIRRWGFVPWKNEIVITPHQPTQISATLVPSSDYLEQYNVNARRERTIAYVAGTAGIFAEAVAVGLFVYNSRRYDNWQNERRQLAADVEAGGHVQNFGNRYAQLNQDEANILRIDDVAISAAILGGAMLATAASLFVWGKDPNKFKTTPVSTDTGVSSKNLAIQW